LARSSSATSRKNQVVHGITRSVQLPNGTRTVEARSAINLWVKLYQEERDRLVRVAKAAIDAGVEERQVRLAEGQARQLAQVDPSGPDEPGLRPGGRAGPQRGAVPADIGRRGMRGRP
jgi:hypothetical protein